MSLILLTTCFSIATAQTRMQDVGIGVGLLAHNALALPNLVNPAGSGSDGYGFKGNMLGMSLSDFKAANPGTVWINTGKPSTWHVNKKLSREVTTPLCTDQYHEFEGDSGPLAEGEVLCNASPGSVNSDGKTIIGIEAIQVLYRFFHSKLYLIQIRVLPFKFQNVSRAFELKYGQPQEREVASFQNGYGATWTGAKLTWKKFPQMIYMLEGSGNGPAQDRFDSANSSSVFISDVLLGPTPGPSLKLDF